MPPDDEPLPCADTEELSRLGLVAVSSSDSLDQIHDEGLVALSCGYDYWVLEKSEPPQFQLLIEERGAAWLQKQLAIYREEAGRPRRKERPLPKGQRVRIPLLLASPLVWTGVAAFQSVDSHLTEAGLSDAQAVMHGEWWRLITALTLHGDFAHLFSNCMGWLLFGAFLATQVGVGMATLLALFAGAMGNGLNALLMADHRSLGASTALFGALGVQTALALFHTQGSLVRRVLIPLLSGFALLAIMGAGDNPRTDVGAHLWGFVCGMALGVVFGGPLLRMKLTAGRDIGFLLIAAVITATAWSLVG